MMGGNFSRDDGSRKRHQDAKPFTLDRDYMTGVDSRNVPVPRSPRRNQTYGLDYGLDGPSGYNQEDFANLSRLLHAQGLQLDRPKGIPPSRSFFPFMYVTRGEGATKITVGQSNQWEYLEGILCMLEDVALPTEWKPFLMTQLKSVVTMAKTYNWPVVRTWSEKVFLWVQDTSDSLTWQSQLEIQTLQFKIILDYSQKSDNVQKPAHSWSTSSLPSDESSSVPQSGITFERSMGYPCYGWNSDNCAEKLVRHLKKNNIPMAIATGSDTRGYKAKISRNLEFFALFDQIVLSSDDPDVKHGKPAPDCFLVAARRFPDNPDPSKCLVFEDAPNGARAGVAAGMPVVWVPDHHVDRSSLEKEVSVVLNTLEDFKPEDFGLPPYEA